MTAFLLRRLGSAILVVILASVLVFLGVRAIPGDPALVLAGDNATPEVLASIREAWGLDQPLPVQFWVYVTQVLQGNFGQSTVWRAPVSQLLLNRLPVSFQLTALAILVGLVVGIPAGIISAVRRGTTSDYVASFVSLIGLSVPHFWLALLGILLFSVNLGWLPASGFVPFFDDPVENLRRIAMPAVVLGVGLSAVLMRQTRSALLGQLSEDYVRTARAKGLPRRTQVRHALRNSLTTVVTVIGLQLGVLISGAVVVEMIFVIPGFGKLMIDAVNGRDYPVIQATVLVVVIAYVVINLLVDLAYSYLNPRMRLTGASE